MPVLSRAFLRTRLAGIGARWLRHPRRVRRTGSAADRARHHLADRVARSTLTHTVEEIAAKIVNVMRNPPALLGAARAALALTGRVGAKRVGRPSEGSHDVAEDGHGKSEALPGLEPQCSLHSRYAILLVSRLG